MNGRILKISRKLVFCSTLILCIGLLTGCSSKEQQARDRIVYLTNIKVPSNSTMVYHHKGETFVGRASQYTVFKFEEKPAEFLYENNFRDGKNDDFEEDYDKEIEAHINARHSTLDIPNQYQANWDNEYLYLYTSMVYFIYFIENQILIVFISAT